MRFRGMAIICGLAVAQALCAAPADDVKALMDQGKPAEAYAQGKKHPDQFGIPAFDFYFGIAAIDAGHAGEGVLALERYALTYPDNVSARLHLARGYFALGEDARARSEFEALRALNPPADITATIDRFLDGIRLRETRYTPSAGLYVEAGAGHDSNVNGGVANPSIFLPNLGPVIVGQAGTRKQDYFGSLAAGAYGSYPVAPGISLFANGQADARFNARSENREFDVGSYNLSAGVSVLREKNLYRFGLNYNYLTLDGKRLREAPGASAEWHYQLDERQAFTLGAQYADFRYNEANWPRDAQFGALSAAYRRQFTTFAWQPIVYASANGGAERSKRDRDDLVRNLWGGRLGVSFTPAAKWGVAAGYSYQRSDYRAPDIILGETRTDGYRALDATVTYLFSRNVSFRVEALVSRNKSNIELFTVPREVYALKARYEFK